MKGQELKIIFKDDLVFLTKEVALDFNQVEILYSPVKFKAPAFWTIRVIDYNENEHKLFVEVLSYQVGETEFSTIQIELADTLSLVEKVSFKSIDTTGLLKTMHGKEALKHPHPKPETIYRSEIPLQPQIKIERAAKHQIYNSPFSISIKDVKFVSGRVTFEKKIQEFGKAIEFEVLNEYIIEEYDAIKNYFANVLKTKKIQVVPTIIMIDGVITSISAKSSEIDKIDKSFIEEVKFELIKTARRNEPLSEKQLFTRDEYFEALVDKQLDAQKLFQDDNDFFDTVLEKFETKHYKHLRFLSSKHEADMQKLHFVHKPFSFVFLLTSIDKFYIVWETLDTQEATYIWSFDKVEEDLKHLLILTEKTIGQIIKEGRNEYINRNETNFNRVFHDYIDPKNGFRNWKVELEKVIV